MMFAFVVIILVWCGFGILGIAQRSANCIAWGMMVFMLATPLIPLAAHLCGFI